MVLAYYRRKPTIVAADQWTGPGCKVDGVYEESLHSKILYYVITIHLQRAYLNPGDYVITEPDGIHHYPCKAEIFENNYELS